MADHLAAVARRERTPAGKVNAGTDQPYAAVEEANLHAASVVAGKSMRAKPTMSTKWVPNTVRRMVRWEFRASRIPLTLRTGDRYSSKKISIEGQENLAILRFLKGLARLCGSFPVPGPSIRQNGLKEDCLLFSELVLTLSLVDDRLDLS